MASRVSKGGVLMKDGSGDEEEGGTEELVPSYTLQRSSPNPNDNIRLSDLPENYFDDLLSFDFNASKSCLIKKEIVDHVIVTKPEAEEDAQPQVEVYSEDLEEGMGAVKQHKRKLICFSVSPSTELSMKKMRKCITPDSTTDHGDNSLNPRTPPISPAVRALKLDEIPLPTMPSAPKSIAAPIPQAAQPPLPPEPFIFDRFRPPPPPNVPNFAVPPPPCQTNSEKTAQYSRDPRLLRRNFTSTRCSPPVPTSPPTNAWVHHRSSPPMSTSRSWDQDANPNRYSGSPILSNAQFLKRPPPPPPPYSPEKSFPAQTYNRTLTEITVRKSPDLISSSPSKSPDVMQNLQKAPAPAAKKLETPAQKLVKSCATQTNTKRPRLPPRPAQPLLKKPAAQSPRSTQVTRGTNTERPKQADKEIEARPVCCSMGVQCSMECPSCRSHRLVLETAFKLAEHEPSNTAKCIMMLVLEFIKDGGRKGPDLWRYLDPGSQCDLPDAAQGTKREMKSDSAARDSKSSRLVLVPWSEPVQEKSLVLKDIGKLKNAARATPSKNATKASNVAKKEKSETGQKVAKMSVSSPPPNLTLQSRSAEAATKKKVKADPSGTTKIVLETAETERRSDVVPEIIAQKESICDESVEAGEQIKTPPTALMESIRTNNFDKFVPRGRARGGFARPRGRGPWTMGMLQRPFGFRGPSGLNHPNQMGPWQQNSGGPGEVTPRGAWKNGAPRHQEMARGGGRGFLPRSHFRGGPDAWRPPFRGRGAPPQRIPGARWKRPFGRRAS